MNTENPNPDEDVAALIQRCRAGEVLFSSLSQEQKEFIRSITTKCPGCGTEFPLYDARQGKFRKACSQKCLGKVRTNRHWECALCQSRFKTPYALQKHIGVVHKEYSLHRYLVAYFKATGKDPTSLDPHCPKCGRERKLNFAKGKYDDCRCPHTIRKLHRLEKLLLQTTDDADKLKIQKQIAGCLSLLARLTGQKKPKKAKLQSAASPASPVPPPPPSKSLITIQDGFDFNGFASYVEGVLSFASPVFDAYYNLVETMRVKSPSELLGLANTALHQLLHQERWVTTLPARSGYLAFVCAFPPDNTDFSMNHVVLYYKELPCDRSRMEQGFSKVSFSREEVDQFLMAQQGKLKYPVAKVEAYQAYYRIVESSPRDVPRLCFNPHVLWHLDQLYRGK